MLCGLNISGTHIAHSNFRVMPICVGMGEGAGAVAAMAVLRMWHMTKWISKKYSGISPRENRSKDKLKSAKSVNLHKKAAGMEEIVYIPAIFVLLFLS